MQQAFVKQSRQEEQKLHSKINMGSKKCYLVTLILAMQAITLSGTASAFCFPNEICSLLIIDIVMLTLDLSLTVNFTHDVNALLPDFRNGALAGMKISAVMRDFVLRLVSKWKCCRWRSFSRGGSVSIYVALYSIGFLFNTLHALSGFVSVALYLSYMGLILWALYLAFGTIGFLSSFFFVFQIFKAIKND